MKVGATNTIPNPLLETRIMSSIETSLQAKGYSLIENLDAADFAIAFTVGSRDEIKVDSYPSMSAGYSRWGGWGGGYYGYGYGTETTVREYTKGMLAIDIFDVGERRPVFHGRAEKTINESDREDVAGTIQAAVDSIMVAFPPM